jgi:hypothetical protein
LRVSARFLVFRRQAILLEAFHLQRTRFERIAERKLRNRQRAADGNVDIDGSDLRPGNDRHR